ncbi:type III pantothenate kinase [Protofrankia symbiont of Coriaria ruscifolia]|uniref:type III pantothenate kinase n=1 Tax=Protofrankia symbiont of Coriaria ruscifolia TaxID=1306542 RepID=UPI001041358E|nr:type III pantothenate kinase [Protofrankia symbiont of Coriaria ruscifolia]
MLLTIDIGNTNTVLGVFDGDRLADSWRVRTNPHSTADELSLLFRGLLMDYDVDGISVCSTVPAALREIRRMVVRAFHEVPAVVVEPGTRTGVPILIDNPKEAGADRIVNVLAAHHLYGGPTIIVDFGTSTNLDVVSSRGEFLGGAFAPGIEIALDALASRAAQLRNVELIPPRSVIGKNTVECLQSGMIYGVVGQVDGLVRRITNELNAEPVVIATGGLAPLVIRESETLQHHEPHLTLIGLRLIFEKNT